MNPPTGVPDPELQSALRTVSSLPAFLAERDRELVKILRDVAGYLSPLRIGVVRRATTTSVQMAYSSNYTFAAADTYRAPYTTRRVDLTAFDNNLIWQYQDVEGNWSDPIELTAPGGSWNIACVAVRIRAGTTIAAVVQGRYEVVLWT